MMPLAANMQNAAATARAGAVPVLPPDPEVTVIRRCKFSLLRRD